nr:PREDICTED: neurochondrin isoform X1 [Daucus carota subsp. sativus]XP_017234158.1 PREDICTED: neurochondrin isoform X2 [Daucus carota subsp. sativus]XP_017234233.1 PREDICTED: neurochondrin isoform X3 [Daucus carota subsp. sativus]
MSQPPVGLNDCLKLLKGERDEQKLAGLLLVTKFINNDDVSSISVIYDAVGDVFLTRLLNTGLGKGKLLKSGLDNRDAYLQLAVTLLASFCRVPSIAASNEMFSKLNLIFEVLSRGVCSCVEECWEFLLLVVNGNNDRIRAFVENGGLSLLGSRIEMFEDGSRVIEIVMRLVELVVSDYDAEVLFGKYASEVAMIVVGVARQFAVLHNNVKFEALHLLSAILSSRYGGDVCDVLRARESGVWADYVRVGVVAILQNRVAPAEKLHALIVAEAVVGIVGKEWFFGPMNLPGVEEAVVPGDRCGLLVLESSRIEIAVLLNDLAYLKFEASKSSLGDNNVVSKERNLCVAFSLVENIVKMIASVAEDEGGVISESTFIKIINGLNETTGVILEYIQDAKVHGQRKGDDLLASVRVIGSYLAETPDACKDKVTSLLDFMLSIEGEDEQSPFQSICFLLPMLCQITMEVDGCRVVAFSGAQKAIVSCLIKLISLNGDKAKDGSLIYLACDTLMNVLLKKVEVPISFDGADVVELLATLVYWSENSSHHSVVMMAATISSLILDFTSEDALRHHPGFDDGKLAGLCQLFKRSMTASSEGVLYEEAEADLYEIVISGYSRWSERFPCIKVAVGK